MGSDALYISVYKALKKKIIDGIYKIDDRLPTEEELTKEYFTSRITIKKAMQLLVEEGFVIRYPGRGTFVSKKFQELGNGNNSSCIVGVILSNISSAFGLDLIINIEKNLSDIGYSCVFKNSRGNVELENKYIDELIQLGCKGLIIQPVHNEFYNEKLIFHHYNNFPIVLIDRDFNGTQMHCVRTDNLEATRKVTNMLFDKGHEKIAFICSKDSTISSIENRKNGFQSAYFYSQKILKEQYIANLLVCSNKNYSKEDFNNDVNTLIEYLKREKEITCLFASEFTACKIIYEAINRMKKNIPNDYSLITFDYSMGLINPNIARIIQNQEFMAQMAVSVLIKLINKENVAVKLYSPYTIYQGNSIKDIK